MTRQDSALEKQPWLPLERGDEILSGETKYEATVINVTSPTGGQMLTQSTEPPWYMIRMPGGVGGEVL
jgi:hypothetical protein